MKFLYDVKRKMYYPNADNAYWKDIDIDDDLVEVDIEKEELILDGGSNEPCYHAGKWETTWSCKTHESNIMHDIPWPSGKYKITVEPIKDDEKVTSVTYDDITEMILNDMKPYARQRCISIANESGLTPYEIEQKKRIAIMSDVTFGNTDRGIALSLTIHISECEGAGALLTGDDATGFIKDYGVNDISQLKGKPVWVLEHGNMISWVGPCKIRVK